MISNQSILTAVQRCQHELALSGLIGSYQDIGYLQQRMQQEWILEPGLLICTLRGGVEGPISLGHAITRSKDGLSGPSVAAVNSVTVEVANAVWRMQCSHPKCRIAGENFTKWMRAKSNMIRVQI